jgi:methionyl-tRNA synthetase
MAKYFLTTPIYYINGLPHIGSAYTAIAADVLARHHRQQGIDVLFSSGTDENSQKTVDAAKAAKKEVGPYTDEMAESWKKTWDGLGISYNRFIRTTEPDHIASVEAFIERVTQNDDLYKDEYEGLYCVGCEEFKSEAELVDGKCSLHNTAPEKRKEENYFFKLSKYQDALLKHIEEHPEFIQPESRRNEVVAFIKRGLHDFSVSRKGKHWGIPWPGDNDQTIYVWFDALTNYLTVAGFPNEGFEKWWPADLHLIGKDISKFHAIYWPAMLMSAGLALPKTVFAHGFFTMDGKKMGKSTGNTIDPIGVAGHFGVDALRYFLLREIPFGQDGDFSQARFEQVYNSDLANELGNAVQRVASMVTKYLGGTIGEVNAAGHDTGRVRQAIEEFRLEKALEEIWVHVKGINQFIEEEKPWELAKTDKEQLMKVLQQAVSDLLHVAELLMPFVPATAQRIVKTFEDGRVHTEVGILFPKLESSPRKQ